MTHTVQTCQTPVASRRWYHVLWICPSCGQAWHTTRTQPTNIAPTSLSWWWRRWPWVDGEPRIEDN